MDVGRMWKDSGKEVVKGELDGGEKKKWRDRGREGWKEKARREGEGDEIVIISAILPR